MELKIARMVADVVLAAVVIVAQTDARGRHFEDGVVELREVAVDALGVAEVQRGHVDGGGDGGVRAVRHGVAAAAPAGIGSDGLKLVEDVAEGDGAVLGPEFEVVEAVKVAIAPAVGNVDGDDAVVICVVGAAAVAAAVVARGHGLCEGGRRQVDLS